MVIECSAQWERRPVRLEARNGKHLERQRKVCLCDRRYRTVSKDYLQGGKATECRAWWHLGM